jgi:chromosome segregation ATPase
MHDITRPDGSRVVRTTYNGTEVARNVPGACIITGRTDTDQEVLDLHRPINVANGYLSLVAVKDLARQEGMLDVSVHEAALTEQAEAIRAEFAEAADFKDAAERTFDGFARDLEAAQVEAAKVAQAVQELDAAKLVIRRQAQQLGEVRARAEDEHEAHELAIATAQQERDQARAELKATIQRSSAEPVAKRGPGRPRKAA